MSNGLAVSKDVDPMPVHQFRRLAASLLQARVGRVAPIDSEVFAEEGPKSTGDRY